MAKSSLQDQLLKAGLASKDKVRDLQREQQKSKKMARKHKLDQVDEAKVAAEKALREKAERDRKLNLEQKAKADEKAAQAQIKQLIEMNRLERDGADIPYNFTDGSKIKKLYVNRMMQTQLSKGLLAIVRLGEHYEVIPAVVAEKIQARDESYLAFRNEPDKSAPAEDDPYADYQVPDDLMW